MKKILIGLLGLAFALSASGAFTDGDTIEVDGAVVNGVQSTVASVNLTEYKDILDAVTVGSQTNQGATTADWIPYWDSATTNWQAGAVNLMFDNAITTASIRGSVTNFASTTNATVVAVFTMDFETSTPSIAATSGDTGLTVSVPAKFRVVVTGSMAAPSNQEFVFQIYADGVACGRTVTANGIGSTKFNNFSIQCTTQVLPIAAEIEVRIFDSGNTINELDMDMHVGFAGLGLL
jgi:hypothetical protein